MTQLEAPARRRLSITLRELFLVILIAALGLTILIQRTRQPGSIDHSFRSLLHIDHAVKYRYWHQHGDRGSGTGKIGSGTEWQNANGIDFFETFIVVHQSNGGRLIPRDGLTYFDWMPRDDSSTAPSTAHASQRHGEQSHALEPAAGSVSNGESSPPAQ